MEGISAANFGEWHLESCVCDVGNHTSCHTKLPPSPLLSPWTNPTDIIIAPLPDWLLLLLLLVTQGFGAALSTSPSSSVLGASRCIEAEEEDQVRNNDLQDIGGSSSSSSSYLMRELMHLGGGSCMNGGVCKNGTCVCKDGWQGSECQFCGGKVR